MGKDSFPGLFDQRRSEQNDLTAVVSPLSARCHVLGKSSRRGGGLRTWLLLDILGPTRRKSFSAGVASDAEKSCVF